MKTGEIEIITMITKDIKLVISIKDRITIKTIIDKQITITQTEFSITKVTNQGEGTITNITNRKSILLKRNNKNKHSKKRKIRAINNNHKAPLILMIMDKINN